MTRMANEHERADRDRDLRKHDSAARSVMTDLPAIPHATTNEKMIVGKLVSDLLAAGFTLSVYDGEEYPLRHSTDPAAIFAALSSTDTDRIYVHSQSVRDRWVLLVWGNDCDVISDYLTSLEPQMAGANALAEELDR